MIGWPPPIADSNMLCSILHACYGVPLGLISVEERKGSKGGPKEKSNCSIVLVKPLANTSARSGDRMALDSSEFGLRGTSFDFHVSQSFDIEHPRYHLELGAPL